MDIQKMTANGRWEYWDVPFGEGSHNNDELGEWMAADANDEMPMMGWKWIWTRLNGENDWHMPSGERRIS